MMSKQKAVIIDLDGTLCNIEHRKKYIDGSLGKKDWDKFYKGCGNDFPNDWCKNIVENIDATILLVTGRPSDYSFETKEWLDNYIFYTKSEVLELFMRKSGDYRADYVIKKEIYEDKIKDNYDILFAIDDRQQVVDMWRELGIVCLQCDEGKF